jgi:hypothetical protein
MMIDERIAALEQQVTELMNSLSERGTRRRLEYSFIHRNM